ncbi:MAG: ribonuclease P protein component [Bacteroidetes bacterium]|nr:MAG: ribonuclease P protein component [Bacteroidota bacterium]
MNQKLTKQERLYRKKEIGFLFEEGKSSFSYPYKIKWHETDIPQNGIPAQILISVSKRSFKKAVSRNKIKRLIKEAYRTQKHQLWEALKGRENQIHIAIIYIDKVENDFAFHQKAIGKLLRKMIEELNK